MMVVKRYRKKPIVVEAVQFDGTEKSFQEISLFTDYIIENFEGKSLLIPTLEGKMIISKGDWIIKGVNGEFYPCNPDIFEKTYEAVE